MRRYTRNNPCPICYGYDNMKRGSSERCYGFISDDNQWAHCTREEYADGLDVNRNSDTYAHRLNGDCRCGKPHDGMPKGSCSRRKSETILATYDYCDLPDNAIRYQVVRFSPKKFRQRRPDGNGGWIWNLGGVERILYRRPQLLSADPAFPVFIPEGEKDVENLLKLGLIATTNSGGAGKFRREYAEDLHNRNVVLLPDNDEVGQNHCSEIANMISSVAASVKIVALPLELKGADVSDWLQAGGTKEQLLALANAAPPFCPSEQILPPRGGGVPAESILFKSPDELFSGDGDVRKWIAYPYIAEAAITEISGLVKSAGKTTFTMHLVRAVLDGSPFMGRTTMKTPVVYLTEQPKSSLEQSLSRAGLGGAAKDLRLLLHGQVMAKKWNEIVRCAIAECERIGARLMVVDTVAQFACLKGDDENSAGAALEAMRPLQEATVHGIAVIMIRHDRKSQGPAGQSGRGSSAWSGVVDTTIAIRRPEGNHKETVRQLDCISRFDGPPERMNIELTENGYVSLGDNDAFRLAQAKENIRKHLGNGGNKGLSVVDLVAATGSSRTTVQTGLSLLLSEGKIEKNGAGVKGNPVRYHLIHSAETPSLVQNVNKPELSDRKKTILEPAEGLQ